MILDHEVKNGIPFPIIYKFKWGTIIPLFFNLDCEQRLKDNVAHRPGRSKQASLTPLLDPWPTLWWPRLADVKA